MKNFLLLTICSLSFFTAIDAKTSEIKISQIIKEAVESSARPASETLRDKHRKPAEVLALMGIKPSMKVVDFTSGGGYYTDILSRVVGEKGQVIAHNPPYVINRFATFLNNPDKGWLARLNSEQWRKNVIKNTDELDTVKLPLELDAALMVLFYHDTVWQGVNRNMMNRRIFNALKPGGVYLIIDHSAKEGSGVKDVNTLHRIEKNQVIKEITSVGFKLAKDSNLLSQKDDKRDYSFVRDRKTKRDRTDRMVLKFVKPIK
ncbi:class I SAM-dependent methyltransferase [Aliikangiella sp. IMCC44359]|uniref:class I SAM-dependent methyltransferase n=1 Tax=Aliikangiella sp. IMCC44359 TaxID=3459125 RepID=UPI00403AAEC5